MPRPRSPGAVNASKKQTSPGRRGSERPKVLKSTCRRSAQRVPTTHPSRRATKHRLPCSIHSCIRRVEGPWGRRAARPATSEVSSTPSWIPEGTHDPGIDESSRRASRQTLRNPKTPAPKASSVRTPSSRHTAAARRSSFTRRARPLAPGGGGGAFVQRLSRSFITADGGCGQRDDHAAFSAGGAHEVGGTASCQPHAHRGAGQFLGE